MVSGTLRAEQIDSWGTEYRITVDGSHITTFNPKRWGVGGRFSLEARDYELRANMWGASTP